MGKILFFIFLAVPLIEITLFIVLGEAVGAVPVLLGVLVTAIIGSLIIRRQGVSLLFEIRTLSARGQLPARQIAEGVMLAVAGALLLTPGYFTDTLGFLLLVPPLRHRLYDYLKSKISVVGVSTSNPFEHPGKAGDAGGSRGRNQGIDEPDAIDPDVIDLDEDDWRRR